MPAVFHPIFRQNQLLYITANMEFLFLSKAVDSFPLLHCVPAPAPFDSSTVPVLRKFRLSPIVCRDAPVPSANTRPPTPAAPAFSRTGRNLRPFPFRTDGHRAVGTAESAFLRPFPRHIPPAVPPKGADGQPRSMPPRTNPTARIRRRTARGALRVSPGKKARRTKPSSAVCVIGSFRSCR